MEEVVGSIPTRSTNRSPRIMPARPSANTEVIPAAADQAPILANLLELYAHDFSDFLDLRLGADGKFNGFPSLPLYWTDPGRYPFLVKADGHLAGLVLVKRGSEFSGRAEAWDMAEFFVVRAYRRRGIGTQIAREVWKRFPGPWEVRVMEANISARRFWERAIPQFTGEAINPVRIEKNGTAWTRFSFESS
jgi:predicted acetyltransferase